MSESPLKDVVSHWHKLIEGLSTSSTDFYAAVERALERREIPRFRTSRVVWDEGGVLAPRREYLRISGDRHSFDLCAAPFGNGFFFSSWLTRRRVSMVLVDYALMLAIAGIVYGVLSVAFDMIAGVHSGPSAFLGFGMIKPIVLIAVTGMVTLGLVSLAARAGQVDPELAVLTIPLVGAFYTRVFAPDTYYRFDTTLMFQSAVHAAILEVIDGLTAQKGLRALSESERKPIFRELVDRQPEIAVP